MRSLSGFHQEKHSDKQQPAKLPEVSVSFIFCVLFGVSEVLKRGRTECVRRRQNRASWLGFTITEAGPRAAWAQSKWKIKRLERRLSEGDRKRKMRKWNEGHWTGVYRKPETVNQLKFIYREHLKIKDVEFLEGLQLTLCFSPRSFCFIQLLFIIWYSGYVLGFTLSHNHIKY